MLRAAINLVRLLALAGIAFPAALIASNAAAMDGALYLIAPVTIAFIVDRLPGKVRGFPIRLSALILLTALASAVFALRGHYVALGLTLILSPVFERAASRAEAWDIRLLLIGGGVYIAAGIAIRTMNAPSLNGPLSMGSAVFLSVAAFFLNSATLRTGYSAQTSARAPAAIRRPNVIATIALILLTIGIACFDKIRAVTILFFETILRAIVSAINWLMSLGATQDLIGEAPAAEQAAMELGEATEPSLLAVILQNIFIALAALLLIYLVYRACKVLAKKLGRALHHLLARLKLYAKSVGDGYVDEQVNLLDKGTVQAVRQRMQRRLKKLMRRERYESLSDAARVRFIVRTLLKRSKADLSSKTLREAIEDMPLGRAKREDVIELYESVRYAEKTPDADEVKRLKREAMV